MREKEGNRAWVSWGVSWGVNEEWENWASGNAPSCPGWLTPCPSGCFSRPCLNGRNQKLNVIIRKKHQVTRDYDIKNLTDTKHSGPRPLNTHAIVSMLMSSEGSKEPLMIWKQMLETATTSWCSIVKLCECWNVSDGTWAENSYKNTLSSGVELKKIRNDDNKTSWEKIIKLVWLRIYIQQLHLPLKVNIQLFMCVCIFSPEGCYSWPTQYWAGFHPTW